MWNAEQFIQGLSAQQLSELLALLTSEEYTNIIEAWEDCIYNSSDDDE